MDILAAKIMGATVAGLIVGGLTGALYGMYRGYLNGELQDVRRLGFEYMITGIFFGGIVGTAKEIIEIAIQDKFVQKSPK